MQIAISSPLWTDRAREIGKKTRERERETHTHTHTDAYKQRARYECISVLARVEWEETKSSNPTNVPVRIASTAGHDPDAFLAFS